MVDEQKVVLIVMLCKLVELSKVEIVKRKDCFCYASFFFQNFSLICTHLHRAFALWKSAIPFSALYCIPVARYNLVPRIFFLGQV